MAAPGPGSDPTGYPLPLAVSDAPCSSEKSPATWIERPDWPLVCVSVAPDFNCKLTTSRRLTGYTVVPAESTSRVAGGTSMGVKAPGFPPLSITSWPPASAPSRV